MKYQTKQSCSKNSQAGFTLIELLITLAIGVIILTQAVPSFVTTVQNSHLTTETNKLVADINLARSEAIKRGVNVAICSSANPNLFVSGAHAPVCGASTNWGTGWIVFADDTPDGSFSAATDTLIRVGIGQASGSSVKFSSSDADISFSSDGLLSDATAKGIIICDDRGLSSSRQILVAATGRPRLDKTVGACS
jgi:type IV fimbrial biogenesis protein FimT